jgi:hypothetical protein
VVLLVAEAHADTVVHARVHHRHLGINDEHIAWASEEKKKRWKRRKKKSCNLKIVKFTCLVISKRSVGAGWVEREIRDDAAATMLL